MYYKTILSAATISLVLSACGNEKNSATEIAAPAEPIKTTVFLFPASNGSNGYELWKTDGSAENTAMVKDINPSGDSNPHKFVRVGKKTFFVANDGTNDEELWVSDGTDTGTQLVKDINPSGSSDPSYLTSFNGKIYFNAEDANGEEELWVSDGTEVGTQILKDISANSNGSYPTDFTIFNGELYFQASDYTGTGAELWKTDGTEAGTVLAADIYAGTGSSSPSQLTVIGDTLYFSATDADGAELWKYNNGTATQVKDIYANGSGSYPSSLTVFSNTLYFSARTAADGTELWSSDGTLANTQIVSNIYSGAGSSYPSKLRVAGDTLYFNARNQTNGYELWKTDGTSTTMVKNINTVSTLVAKASPSAFLAATTGTDQSSSLSRLVSIGSNVLFSANDGTNGSELWASNGTEAGTTLIKDIHSSGSSTPSSLGQLYYSDAPVLTLSDGTVLFQAMSADKGIELWKSDGTSDGTLMIMDINPDMGNGLPSQAQ